MRLSVASVAVALAWTAVIASAAGAAATPADDELPEGPGKRILDASCTSCHGLDEVTKFKGFYTRAQWRDVVVTMVDYGARVEPAEIEVLADYLAEHLGKK